MIGKKRKNSKKKSATMLQKTGNSPGGHNALPDEVRERFYEAYEKTCGNISASCEYAGMDRATYYRWMDSDEPHNVAFRNQLTILRPKERLKDLAEAVIVEKLAVGKSFAAAKMVLERLAKDRGYGPQVILKDEFEQVIKAVERLQKVVEIQQAKNPEWKFDLRTYAEIAAEDFKVPVEAIEKEFLKRQPQGLGDIG